MFVRTAARSGCRSNFYQIFPDRFARSQSREAGQDKVYYHHAAGHDIVRKVG